MNLASLESISDRLLYLQWVLEMDWSALDRVMERILGEEQARSWMLVFEYDGVGVKFAWRSDL